MAEDTSFDAIKTWFVSLEETGEFIGIRFGRIPPGESAPQWRFIRHTDVDGIGGFAKMLRSKGVAIEQLPQNKHPAPPSRLAVLKSAPKFLMPQHKLAWRSMEGPTQTSDSKTPPQAVAWHVFDEASTLAIRRLCRKTCITVNSYLLKHLCKAIRPCLEDQSAIIPWMVPVNLRGKVARKSDEENHTSYATIKVHPYDTAYDVHRKVYAALGSGEHWANWFAYQSSRVLTGGMRRYLIRIEKCMSEWNIGSFSNLGVWDEENEITDPDLVGNWLFAPPVLRCQPLGMGCVTFQNRLSLVAQVHPEVTTNSAVPRGWMQNWVKEIEIDIAANLAEPVAEG
jgi:hypothetical protein